MKKKEEVVEDKDNGPPPKWKLTPKLPPLQTSTPPSGTQGASLEGESFPFHLDSKCPYKFNWYMLKYTNLNTFHMYMHACVSFFSELVHNTNRALSI